MAMSGRVGSILIVLLLSFFIYMGYRYIHYRSVNAVSDAAFIKSDQLSTLSFKVGGRVVNMRVEENEKVRRGELLAEIDPVDLKTKRDGVLHSIESLEKEIEAARLSKERLKETLRLKSEISRENLKALQMKREGKRHEILSLEEKLEKSRKDTERYHNMLEKRLIAKADYESVYTAHRSMSETLLAMRKSLQVLEAEIEKAKRGVELAELTRREIEETQKSIEAMEARKRALKSSLEELEKSISYTKLHAPFDGVVAKKFFDAPHMVKRGSPVYAIVDPASLYCEVLLSEKKLTGVHRGNRVKIEVDALKGRTFRGVVESISPTSASTFSLVPRDIASGEFTKLDQRFKVRIRLEKAEGLRAGMGATVAIERSGA